MNVKKVLAEMKVFFCILILYISTCMKYAIGDHAYDNIIVTPEGRINLGATHPDIWPYLNLQDLLMYAESQYRIAYCDKWEASDVQVKAAIDKMNENADKMLSIMKNNTFEWGVYDDFRCKMKSIYEKSNNKEGVLYFGGLQCNEEDLVVCF